MGVFGKFLKKEKKTEKPQAISYENLRLTIMKRHDLKTDHKEAITEFEAVARDQPDTPDKLYWLGVLQYDIASLIRDVEKDDVFYSSPKYRDWYNRNMMPNLRASGAPSNLTVDKVLADMRSKDQTPYSAVCEECVELFL